MRKELHERWAWADIWCLWFWWLKKQKHATAVIKSVKQLLFSALMSQFNMLSLFAITLRCNINNSVDYQKCCSFGISFCGCRETAGIWPCLIIVAIKKVWNKMLRHNKKRTESFCFWNSSFIHNAASLFVLLALISEMKARFTPPLPRSFVSVTFLFPAGTEWSVSHLFPLCALL